MKISIISPVYNVAPYIRDCIDSIKAQSMQDFEVLFIDDHGQDDSIAIAKDYTQGDERFRFLSTSCNSGPGVARNVGIEAARGEYLSFIDSDDKIDTTFLEKLYLSATQNATSESGSCSVSYCQLRYSTGPARQNPVLPAGIFSSRRKKYFLAHFVTFSVCFLFRRDFLIDNDLRFPARRNSEDTNFLTRSLLLAPAISCVNEPLYVYCVREQSLTTCRNRRRWLERIEAMNALMRDFHSLKRNPRYVTLHLSQYNFAMILIWLKKGLVQALLEFFR